MNHVFPTMVIVGYIKMPMLEMGVMFQTIQKYAMGNHHGKCKDSRRFLDRWQSNHFRIQHGNRRTKIFQIYDDYSVHISETI